MRISPSMFQRATNDGNLYLGEFCIAAIPMALPHTSARFRGTAGDAIITRTSAYLFVDSRYWVSAQQQLDKNWQLIKAGSANGPKDWIEWLVVSSTVCVT